MTNDYNELLNLSENEIRLGNYELAQNYAQQIQLKLKNTPVSEKVVSGKRKIVTETFLGIIPLKSKYVDSYSDLRHDDLIVLYLKAKLLESLTLFYQKKTSFGIQKLEDLYLEVKSLRNVLLNEQRIELNRFIDDFNDEIQEVCLLNDFLSLENSSTIEDEIDLAFYSTKTKEELYLLIGERIPENIRENAKIIANKIALLKSGGKILIGPTITEVTETQEENIEFGKKLSNALKKSLYNVLCSPKDRVGKELISNERINYNYQSSHYNGHSKRTNC